MHHWTVLVSAAALIFYIYTGVAVGRLRILHKTPAPAMSGHPEVERALRVQGNTLEWLVIFLPSLWMFQAYWSPAVGAGLGVVWILGRILYMAGYMKDAAKRGPGFGIQFLATAALLVGAAVGAVLALA